jgi:large subunit ribosomal protein L21
MYAIIDLGGKQYKVEKGDEVVVDRLDVDEGKTMQMKPVLLGGKKKAVTAEELKGVKVKAKVEEHVLGEKIRVFKYKPKRGYKRSHGHRSRLSRITIQSITDGTKKAPAKKAPAKKAEAKKSEAKKETKAEAAADKK